MWNRADIAAEIVKELDAFLFRHNIGERKFLEDLGTNTSLIRNLRAGGSVTTETIGRLRDRMTAIDPNWRLRGDWKDQVSISAEQFCREPTDANLHGLKVAVRCLARWPLTP